MELKKKVQLGLFPLYFRRSWNFFRHQGKSLDGEKRGGKFRNVGKEMGKSPFRFDSMTGIIGTGVFRVLTSQLFFHVPLFLSKLAANNFRRNNSLSPG